MMAKMVQDGFDPQQYAAGAYNVDGCRPNLQINLGETDDFGGTSSPEDVTTSSTGDCNDGAYPANFQAPKEWQDKYD
eukprot:scaffold155584_cov33-Prasinocladus_malaysianus.AAC.1